MKRNKTKKWIVCGIICALIATISTWYSIVFNDSRFVAPMNFKELTISPKDLPMIFSVFLVCVYVITLFVKLCAAVRNKQKLSHTRRKVNPKLGFLGFLGMMGFVGFATYSINGTVFPFCFFIFFGFFGFFYEGKMSETFMDERFYENKAKAQLNAYKISFTIIFIALLVLCQGKLFGNLEYTLIATIIIISLALAVGIFLSEFLLYRYDYDDHTDESEE